MTERGRAARAWICGAAWGSAPTITGVRMAAHLVDREEAELAIRTVVTADELEGWLALAEETGAWQGCYEAACLGLSLEEWAPAARAGHDFTVALEAIRRRFEMPELEAQRIAERLRRFAEETPS
jgi:hypothetical protein